MNIRLDKIDTNSSLDGLELLKEISNDPNNFNESPVPKEINEYLYKGFLLLSEEESKEGICDRFWIKLNNKKIGYADIKVFVDNSKDGNVGIILSKDYRNKGIGKIVLNELIKMAKKDYNMSEVLVTTAKDNIAVRKICESLGGEITETDKQCLILFKSNKKRIKQ